MKCLKCGSDMRDDEIVCGVCGYNKNNTVSDDNKFAVRNIGVYNQNPVDQQEVARKQENEKQFEELVELYIGPKHNNFRKGSFSWCAFFFGPLYFAYRKLYAVAGILYALNLVINWFFSKTISNGLVVNNSFSNTYQNIFLDKGFIVSSVVFLIFQIFQGIIFKRFYFNEVVERVGKIKQENPDINFNQLAEIVKKKGGTNPLVLLIVALIYISIIILFALMVMAMLGAAGVI